MALAILIAAYPDTHLDTHRTQKHEKNRKKSKNHIKIEILFCSLESDVPPALRDTDGDHQC